MLKKPIVVRLSFRKCSKGQPFVFTALAGKEAEVCHGFGTLVHTKKDFLQMASTWFDVMEDVEKRVEKERT